MSLEETNKRIEELFKEWQGLQPLKPKRQEELDKKIWLEWNFHSNHIEGNTLTYNETEILLIENKEEGNHPPRDYMEIKAHDLAIEKVKEFVRDKGKILKEGDIRNLNQIILKEPFWKEAITGSGKKVPKEIFPGQYKKQSNHVRTETGEIFKFAEPFEVAPKMKDLVEWFNTEIQEMTLPIASFLAELHHRFICIHPFDDGNGRIARLWMNYALMRLGYPPMVIESKNKRNYFAALQKADNGDMDTFAVYLGNVLILWLEMGVEAAKGKNIREVTDIDKEWSMFIRDQESKGLKVILSSETIQQIYENCFMQLCEQFTENFNEYSKMFNKTQIKALISPNYVVKTDKGGVDIIDVIALFASTMIAKEIAIATNAIKTSEEWKEQIRDLIQESGNTLTDPLIIIQFSYEQYIGQSKKLFNADMALFIKIDEFNYKTWIAIKNPLQRKTPKKTKIINKEYKDAWTRQEIDEFIAEGKTLLFEIVKGWEKQ